MSSRLKASCSCTKLSLHDGNVFVDHTLYRSTIRALQYLINTRLDVAFIVSKLSWFFIKPTDIHYQTCKHVLWYLKGTVEFGLWFKACSQLTLEVYADAD